MPIETSKQKIVHLLGARADSEGANRIFNSVCKDLDKISGGELFVAKTASIASEALSKGAALALCADPEVLTIRTDQDSYLYVDDLDRSLEWLATWWLREQSIKIVLVAGAYERYSVKEFLARMLLGSGRGIYSLESESDSDETLSTLFRISPDDNWLLVDVNEKNINILINILAEQSIKALVYSGRVASSLTTQINSELKVENLIIEDKNKSVSQLIAIDKVHTFAISQEGSKPVDLEINRVSALGIRGVDFSFKYKNTVYDLTLSIPGEHIPAIMAPVLLTTLITDEQYTVTKALTNAAKLSPIKDRLSFHRLPGDRYIFVDSIFKEHESIKAMLGLARVARSEGMQLAYLLGEYQGQSESLTEVAKALAESRPLVVVLVASSNSESLADEFRALSIPVYVVNSAEAAVHTLLKFPFEVLFVKQSSNNALGHAISVMLDIEGEVLEIPNYLQQFGKGEKGGEEG